MLPVLVPRVTSPAAKLGNQPGTLLPPIVLAYVAGFQPAVRDQRECSPPPRTLHGCLMPPCGVPREHSGRWPEASSTTRTPI